ncbi:EthD family reductase [Fibrella sp. HMF5335]|uniref:EthD family reductase n=1 Tax=Fibrella rubiginis TaxID=2817060 RepID=A0A939K481_9BACT|nr:EthD family reductase [Fibrella rubiginis]MBO0938154.1 EthD family reductase [Fibrella rubiginis]
MFSVTVLYPNTIDSRFDMDYYLNHHTPLVRDRLMPMGLTGVDLKEGIAGGTPGSPQAYTMITQLNFGSMDDLQNAMATHGPELIGDIANFTDVQPQMQISRAV